MRTNRMTKLFSVALTLLMAAHALAANSVSGAGEGSICLAPLPENTKAADHDLPGNRVQRREPAYKFTVQIDERDPVPIPTDGRPLQLPPLPLGAKHLIKIRDAGELIESFFFTFEARGGNRLCLGYGPWYQTWFLDLPGRKPWCQCQSK
jgi:hypothetical protein